MADLIRVQLTGTFRDRSQVVPLTGEQDPGCEAQFLDIAEGGTATNQTAKVIFASGAPCPWYAAMAYFFGTVQCTTSSMVVDTETLRTYTAVVPPPPGLTTALARRVPNSLGELCIVVPAEAKFHGVVIGRTQPARTGELDLPEPPGALGSGSWSSMPVLPDSWGRFVFIAPDGSTYGSGMDSSRWVRGYYPGPLITANDPPGQDTPTKAAVASGMQPLQVGTNVVLVARFFDAAAPAVPSYDQAYSWHVVPGEAPPATIQLIRNGTDQWGQTWNEYNVSQTYTNFAILAYDAVAVQWDLASVIPSTPTADDNTARRDRTILGVLLGINGPTGAPGCATLTVCTAGRFWVDPNIYALADHTDCFIASSATAGGVDQGLISAVPCAFSCRRPVFHHFTSGWCEMYPQGLGPGQRFRYDLAAGQEAIVDIAEGAPTSTPASQMRLAYRDFAGDSVTPESIGDETDDVLAWFLSPTTASDRALVVKRGDLVINIGAGQTEDPDAPSGTRGGRICIPYDDTDRVTDAYLGPVVANDVPWFVIQPGPQQDSAGSQGALLWKDNGDVVMAWNGAQAADTLGTSTNRNFSTWLTWFHMGGWDWQWYDSSSVLRVSITEADIAAVGMGGLALYVRKIEVCGPGGPTDIRHIGILATDEF